VGLWRYSPITVKTIPSSPTASRRRLVDHLLQLFWRINLCRSHLLALVASFETFSRSASSARFAFAQSVHRAAPTWRSPWAQWARYLPCWLMSWWPLCGRGLDRFNPDPLNLDFTEHRRDVLVNESPILQRCEAITTGVWLSFILSARPVQHRVFR